MTCVSLYVSHALMSTLHMPFHAPMPMFFRAHPCHTHMPIPCPCTPVNTCTFMCLRTPAYLCPCPPMHFVCEHAVLHPCPHTLTSLQPHSHGIPHSLANHSRASPNLPSSFARLQHVQCAGACALLLFFKRYARGPHVELSPVPHHC